MEPLQPVLSREIIVAPVIWISAAGSTRDNVLPFASSSARRKPTFMEVPMVFDVGNVVALICIVISIIFAVVTGQATNALWWALLAIFAVLWWGARAPWGS